MEPLVVLRGITKHFPGVLANDAIDLEVYPGEVHALLGENGAGKTTLMNILYGLYQPDKGEIFFRGKKVNVDSPSTAIRLGIGMVHQHFMLIPPFTVAENVVLGAEPRRGMVLDREKAMAAVRELAGRYGFQVDPAARIENTSVGTQQKVELLKALYRGADLLILDEPTAVLTPQEVLELKGILDHLTSQGKAVILITHKLREVMEMSHRVTVIRRGKKVGTYPTSEVNPNLLARLMVGHELELEVKKKPFSPGKVLLEVENLQALNARRLPALQGVSFQLREGEILGIAGVDGNGQTELVEVLSGLRKATGGRVVLCGREITNASPRLIRESGLAHIAEDRHKRGLVLDFTVAENLVLGQHYRPPVGRGLRFFPDEMRRRAGERIQQYDVRTPSEDIPVSSLSGGNQQKVVLARELSAKPVVIIAAQPTRGLDVGAMEFVHRQLLAHRDAGGGVLLLSLELEEILALSDRIAVMYEGRIVAIMDASEATEEKIGLLMTGGGKKLAQA